MKKKIKNVAVFIILLLASIMIIGSIYYHIKYPKQDFDQIIFYLMNGAEKTAPSIVNDVIFTCAIPVIILFSILYLLTVNVQKKKYINVKIKNKQIKFKIFPVNIITEHRAIYASIVFAIAILFVIFNFKIDRYLINIMQETSIYEDYYVDGNNVEISFPEEKRNLIIIVVESMENTVLTKENGGNWEYSITPELEKLANENLNFSNSEGIGGAYETFGTNYSAGGNVAITAGIPLKTGNILPDKNEYNGNGKYLAGAYTLGEILQEQGYNLEIIMGSDSTFGGRKQYYETNGQYKIFDVNYAIQTGKMTESERVWWGFEDEKLFNWSKEELTNLANQEKPFNYIMLTADTHFMDGYLSNNAEKKFDTQYENVYAYSSKLIYEFIEWIKEQNFYKDTTIVIVGDHLGMQTEFYEEKMDENYNRTIYNVIINSQMEATNNKNRIFTSMDMYPTILASIGATIEGNKLGLGTNLFSEIPTLAEKISFMQLNKELEKHSSFYNKYILGDDYYVMKKNTQKEQGANNEGNNESI